MKFKIIYIMVNLIISCFFMEGVSTLCFDHDKNQGCIVM
jgi:hypothetical protein